MRVKVLFFGMLKDVTGYASDEVELPAPADLQAVWAHYAAAFPALNAHKPHVRLARNGEFSPLDAAISHGDEIAFLPPVSGGSGREGVSVALTREPIDTRALVALTVRDADGAVVTFEGVVRDNTQGRPTAFLEYEGYESMALRMVDDLGADLRERHAIDRISIVHRLGTLAIGEASVVIVVSAAHRKPAFAACLEAIDRLKATVPIWKKEHFEGGEVWVAGQWEQDVFRS